MRIFGYLIHAPKVAPGEKPLFLWIGFKQTRLLAMPDPRGSSDGCRLSVAQYGGKHWMLSLGKDAHAEDGC